MEGKSRGGSTTQINTTNTDGVTTEYTSKEPIEKIIAKGNDENSHQCEGRSQLLTHQFISDLGHHGEGKFTNKVLDGTYVLPDNTSPATRDFLHACQSHADIATVQPDHDIRSRYWATKNLWNKRRESTCTYHQHVGHYQAAMKDNNLSWFFFQRGEVPTISGYSPKRHRECVDLMIMKKNSYL